MDIFKAIEVNDIARVKELLDYGTDVNIQNNLGQTPLYVACENDFIKVVKLLLAHSNINVNIKNKNGWTSLHKASVNNRIEIVKLLLTHSDIQVDLNYKNYKNFKIKNLLKSYTNIYKNSINKILDTMEN